jgi:hypothetical protein
MVRLATFWYRMRDGGYRLESDPDPSRLPPWMNTPEALEEWFCNANKLRSPHAPSLWSGAAACAYTYTEMSFLRRLNCAFGDFRQCQITVYDDGRLGRAVDGQPLIRVGMALYLSMQDAHALGDAEGLDYTTPETQPFGGIVLQPAWSSMARYESGPIHADSVASSALVLCLNSSDVHPYVVVMRGAPLMWSKVRAFVRMRIVAIYWQERTHKRLCAPDGAGRQLDQLAFETWRAMGVAVVA